MPNITKSPNFRIKPMTPDEWRINAQGKLALIPGFWEGAGADLGKLQVTPLGAFDGDQMLGYIGVRAVGSNEIETKTKGALKHMIKKRRSAGAISAAAFAAVEAPADLVVEGETVAYNLGFALVGERRQGVGTALAKAALDLVGAASPDRPMPAYACIALQNTPTLHFSSSLGFEPLMSDGRPYLKDILYYGAPDAQGQFAEPILTEHVFLGTVVEGGSAPQ